MLLPRNLVLVIPTLIALALVPSAVGAQTACHLLDSSTAVPPDFGAAYNPFSSKKELVVKVHCGPGSKVTLAVGNGQSSLFIYKLAYEWTGSIWRELPLNGSNRTGNWYTGSAAASLVRSETQLSQDNFVAVWTCFRDGINWRCGCREVSCTPSYWQLQAFKYVPSDSDGGQATGSWDPIPGMNLHWSWTPKPSDEGKTGEAAGYWFMPPHTIAEPTSSWKRRGEFRISAVHSGDLGFEILARANDHHYVADIRPVLWPNDTSKSPHVWRLRFRMYLQDNHVRARSNVGMKMPGGMIYGVGPRAGNTPFSKAGESCPGAGSFRSSAARSASVRLQPGTSLRWPLYSYFVPVPGKDCPFRLYTPGEKKVEVGKWLAIEMEFKNQSGTGKADGYVKLWVDGQFVVEQKNVLWVPPGVPPQGFRGPWFDWYNGGTATLFKEDTRLWLRDIEVWTKG